MLYKVQCLNKREPKFACRPLGVCLCVYNHLVYADNCTNAVDRLLMDFHRFLIACWELKNPFLTFRKNIAIYVKILLICRNKKCGESCYNKEFLKVIISFWRNPFPPLLEEIVWTKWFFLFFPAKSCTKDVPSRYWVYCRKANFCELSENLGIRENFLLVNILLGY